MIEPIEFEEVLTEYIRCEYCDYIFDHDSSQPGPIFCPACHGKITDESLNVERPEDV